MSTELLVIIALAVCAVALIAALSSERRKVRRLRIKYGPEYARLVAQEHGRTRRADQILDARERRVRKLGLRHLTPPECDRFANQWRLIQEEFVDNPTAAVTRADSLMTEALVARGYPTSDFEQRVADISVEHPQLVTDYRVAHDISERDRIGQVTTEELRRAMQHYRGLFEQVLESHIVHPAEVRP
jgi:hypothetical protein